VLSAAQDALAVYAWRRAGVELAAFDLAFALGEDVDQVEGVDVTRDIAAIFVNLVVHLKLVEQRDVPEDCEADVDQEVDATACDCEDADGRDCRVLDVSYGGKGRRTEDRAQDQEKHLEGTHFGGGFSSSRAIAKGELYAVTCGASKGEMMADVYANEECVT
jgi:hypothetical protein